MHDIVFVENLKGLQKLFQNEQGFLFLQGVFFPEKAFEGATIAVFVDEIEVILSFEHIVVGDDVFIFLDVGEDVNFMNCAFF